MGKKSAKRSEEWLEAKRGCRLSDGGGARIANGSPVEELEGMTEEDIAEREYEQSDAGNSTPDQEDAETENGHLLVRYENLRAAAEAVAAAMGRIPEVQKVALFGSVARPLKKEVPRFRKYRRAGIELWHECKDVDLAVWVSDLGVLRSLYRARGQTVGRLRPERGLHVAHHQVDVFIFEPGTDRYRGRLCIYSQCPYDKPECYVAGCGAAPLLQQHEGFRIDWLSASEGSVVLFERERPAEPPQDSIPF